MDTFELIQSDLQYLASQGITVEDVEQQVKLLLENGHATSVARPCTINDGIQCLSATEEEALLARAQKVMAEGRLLHFVPASGAATRMFSELVLAQDKNFPLFNLAKLNDLATVHSFPWQRVARSLLKFFSNLKDFAFYPALEKVFEAHTKIKLRGLELEELFKKNLAREVINSLLEETGLAYSTKPKALIDFHIDSSGRTYTALEEHLSTALEAICDKNGTARIHFTVSKEHLSEISRVAEIHKGKYIEVSFSCQKPSTNTIAICLSDDHEPSALLRDASGQLILRPGGHGALLSNLQDLADAGSELVYINNIDNVLPKSKRAAFIKSEHLLIGLYSKVQEFAHSSLRDLQNDLSAQRLTEIRQQIHNVLNLAIADSVWPKESQAQRKLLIVFLNRPMRVVGVVKNETEPGGGPFWVPDSDWGESLQIVEKDELDRAEKVSGTHFNPVRIVAGLRDYQGKAFKLSDFVNPNAIFCATKVQFGQRIRVLERPGLWNGAMGKWITLMLEVAPESFAPVKHINDLLRPSHFY